MERDPVTGEGLPAELLDVLERGQPPEGQDTLPPLRMTLPVTLPGWGAAWGLPDREVEWSVEGPTRSRGGEAESSLVNAVL